MSINKTIITSLEGILPIALHEYEGNSTTYATFFIYNELPNMIADDEEIRTTYSVQIDVYTKGNVETLSKQVIDALQPHGFKRVNATNLFETETKTYRKMLQFKVVTSN